VPEVSGPSSGETGEPSPAEPTPGASPETSSETSSETSASETSSGETSSGPGPDDPTPPHGTPAATEVPAWDPGPGAGPQAPPPAPAYGGPGPGGPGYGGPGPGGPGYGGPPAGTPPGAFGMLPRAPRPGIVPLRPLALGEVLDGAMGYIRAHPRVVLGTSAVVAVVTQLVQLVLNLVLGASTPPPGTSPDLATLTAVVGGSAVTQLVTAIVTLVAVGVLTGILMVTISRAVLGAPVDAGEVWRAARPRVPGVIGLSLLVGLIVAGILLVGAVPGLLLLLVDGTLGGVVIALGVIAAVVVAVWVGVSLSLATPAYVLEGVGIGEALRRSWFLVRGRFWPVLGTQVVGTIIVLAVTAAFSFVLALVGVVASVGAGGGLGASPTASPAVLVIGAIVGIIASTVTQPFQAGITGLLYVDQRMRREGFDIELQRASSGGQTGGS
jgi:hypothetical protein